MLELTLPWRNYAELGIAISLPWYSEYIKRFDWVTVPHCPFRTHARMDWCLLWYHCYYFQGEISYTECRCCRNPSNVSSDRSKFRRICLFGPGM